MQLVGGGVNTLLGFLLRDASCLQVGLDGVVQRVETLDRFRGYVPLVPLHQPRLELLMCLIERLFGLGLRHESGLALLGETLLNGGHLPAGRVDHARWQLALHLPKDRVEFPGRMFLGHAAGRHLPLEVLVQLVQLVHLVPVGLGQRLPDALVRSEPLEDHHHRLVIEPCIAKHRKECRFPGIDLLQKRYQVDVVGRSEVSDVVIGARVLLFIGRAGKRERRAGGDHGDRHSHGRHPSGRSGGSPCLRAEQSLDTGHECSSS